MPLFQPKSASDERRRQLQRTVNELSSYIESVRGDVSLNDVYTRIGESFLDAGVITCFLGLLHNSTKIQVKRYFAPPELTARLEQALGHPVTELRTALTDDRWYQQIIDKQDSLYVPDRLKHLTAIAVVSPAAAGAFADLPPYHAIIVPFLLHGEPVGLIEYFAPFLAAEDRKLFDNFTHHLVQHLTNLILYREVRRSERRYRSLFDSTPSGMVAVRIDDRRISETNRSFKTLTGFTEGELTALRFEQLFSAPTRAIALKVLEPSLSAEPAEIAGDQGLLLAKDGRSLSVQLFPGPSINREERIIMVVDKSREQAVADALAASEERYRSIVEGASDYIFTVNRAGIVLSANQAAAGLFRLAPDQLIGKTIDHLFPPELSGRYRGNIVTVFDTGVQHRSDSTMMISGEQRWIGTILDPVRNHRGAIIAVLGIVRDVTDSHRLQEQIARSKTHYEQLIDSIQDGICVVDRKLAIASCNRTFADRVGLPFQEIKGRPCTTIFHRYHGGLFTDLCDPDPACRTCKINQVLKSGEADSYVHPVVDNGKEHTFRVQIFPMKETDGTTGQAVVTIRDITEELETKEEIRRLSELSKRILDTSPLSILALDRKGAIIAANQHGQELLGGSDQSVIGSQLTATPEIAGNAELRENYRRLIDDGLPFTYQGLTYVKGATGERRHLDVSAVPLRGSDGNVEGAVSIAVDTTEIIHAREKLEDLNDTLEQKVLERTRELAAINRKLAEVLELKSQFIADASHELRTPLTVLQGNLELTLREPKISAEMVETVNILLEEVSRMSQIIADLTMLTTLDSYREQTRHEPVDLVQLVWSVCQSLQIIADQKGLVLRFDQGAAPLVILGDDEKLEKLLLNIVRNAIRYTERGSVDVRLETDSEEARIIVTDTGIGIPQKDLPYIFERFYRVDKARSRAEGGTGLGLSIVDWVVRMHRGRITVTSEEGKGSVFTVHLPYDHKRSGGD